jgi:lipopolysaccharide export system permease protein
MRQIDRLVLKEIVGPWLFGVGLFTALLLAATYLNRIADYVVRGVPPSTIAQLTALLLPAILVKTFGMSMLLATLLAFGRLSSDSEIVSLRAAGASIARIVFPVMGFSLFIAGVTFMFNEKVVPPAANKASEMLVDLADKGNPDSGEPIVVRLDEGKALLAARSFNIAGRIMNGVTLTTYDDDGHPKYILLAREMEYRGEHQWHIRGSTTLLSAQGGWRLQTNEVWPEQIPQLTQTPQDIITINNNDNDLYTLAQIKSQIDRGSREHNLSKSRIANLWYGYWSKFSVPLAAFIFGTLGAVLGIRNARTGTATGFALAVAIIFAYVTLANFMNVWALNGVLPAWVAAFLPVTLGFAGAMYLMWRRNA